MDDSAPFNQTVDLLSGDGRLGGASPDKARGVFQFLRASVVNPCFSPQENCQLPNRVLFFLVVASLTSAFYQVPLRRHEFVMKQFPEQAPAQHPPFRTFLWLLTRGNRCTLRGYSRNLSLPVLSLHSLAYFKGIRGLVGIFNSGGPTI